MTQGPNTGILVFLSLIGHLLSAENISAWSGSATEMKQQEEERTRIADLEGK
jgi:hypothetical protein